jgi:3-phenylpropionate/trans-cinnamate dioxygenase ferredoxin subunit
MAHWIDVASVSELPPGAWRSVDVDGSPVAVFNVDGEFCAIDDVCTHDFGTLTGGTVEDGVVVCPRHGARFAIRTGEVLAPPAYEDVATHAVRVEAGVVQVSSARSD